MYYILFGVLLVSLFWLLKQALRTGVESLRFYFAIAGISVLIIGILALFSYAHGALSAKVVIVMLLIGFGLFAYFHK